MRTALALLTITLLPQLALADVTINLGRGPVTVETPAGYDPSVPAPVLISLHGYTGNGAFQSGYMEFGPLVDEFGLLYAYPNGSVDSNGARFWNATDACCNFFGSTIDDVTYLRDIVSEISTQFNVDPRRVYFAGHSNGGFMNYRMACDASDLVAGIASLAGATFDDPNDCTPTEPVAVLQIHGTSDNTILYNGGNVGGPPYPGAIDSVEIWAAYNGCDLVSETGDPLNVDRNLPGQETTVDRYVSNCTANGQTELWTIVGGSHTPNLSAPFPRRVLEWYFQHPKANPCPGDTNNDGNVDLSDLSLVLAQFGTLGPAGDLNGDLTVDLSDLAEVLAQFGTTCP